MFEIICGNDFSFGGGTFTCTFYCRTETDAFPDAAWTDFAATVLDGWADALLAVANRERAGFRLLFEDGPFRLEGRKDGARALLRPRLVREPLRDPLLRPLDRRNQGEKR